MRRPSTSRLTPWLCAALLAGSRPVRSQPTVRSSIDAGAATLWQRELDAVTAPTIAGDVRLDTRRLALRALGGAAFGGSERQSAQLDGGASWVALAGRRTALELGAQGSALRFNGSPASTTASVLARAHAQLPGFGAWTTGLWGGAGVGRLGREVGTASTVTTLEAGGWLRRSQLHTSLTVATQRTRLDTIGAPAVARSFAALDATLFAEWRSPTVELSATTIARRAPNQSSSLLGAIYATGAWWLTSRLAATASAGDLAADPLRGFPSRRLVAAGLRWRLGALVKRPRASAATVTAEVVRRGGATVLRVHAPAARQVEVRGDFTGWQPVPLVRAGAAWELRLDTRAAGTVRLALRIDGGAWRLPENLPAVEDDFGERSALLVIP